MATRSIILAWRIPWTEELGGLQSVGLQCRMRLSLAQHPEDTETTFRNRSLSCE